MVAALLIFGFVRIGESDYELVWSDEFNSGSLPDADKWSYEKGYVRNKELQYYTDQNAHVVDGILVIEARNNLINNQRGDSQTDTNPVYEYTSSSINTKGKHAWQYGRFEIRAKIPAVDGSWPAIWFLGVNGKWPHNGEIDLMEYYRGMILANAAWGDKEAGQAIWDSFRKPVDSYEDGWVNKYHVWKMDWDEKSISLFVDDVLLNEIDLSKTQNLDGSGFNPFHQKHFMLLNLAIGGTQGGDPSNTVFPLKYEIDYVRVYQKKLR